MLRRVTAGLIVAGLAVGIWLVWPEGDAATPTSTTVSASATTTTTSAPEPSSPPAITPDAHTTTTGDAHVVETVEEAEAILRELWFGWFEGIYEQDEDRIREVVATEEQVQAAIAQFGKLEFLDRPTSEGMVISKSEILRADDRCLVVFAQLDFSTLTGARTEGVHVLRHHTGRWLFVSLWRDRGDLWEDDCAVQLS